MGQQITLFAEWSVIPRDTDTLLNDFMGTPVKMIVWYDSLSCASCQVNRMYEWTDIVAYADSFAQWFSIIYLFTPKKEDLGRVNMALNVDNLDYPIFIDQNGSFVKQNSNLPKNRQLHSFLLDKNNRVVLVGSPLYNPSLWELYMRTIQKMIDNDGVLPEQHQ